MNQVGFCATIIKFEYYSIVFVSILEEVVFYFCLFGDMGACLPYKSVILAELLGPCIADTTLSQDTSILCIMNLVLVLDLAFRA